MHVVKSGGIIWPRELVTSKDIPCMTKISSNSLWANEWMNNVIYRCVLQVAIHDISQKTILNTFFSTCWINFVLKQYKVLYISFPQCLHHGSGQYPFNWREMTSPASLLSKIGMVRIGHEELLASGWKRVI